MVIVLWIAGLQSFALNRTSLNINKLLDVFCVAGLVLTDTEPQNLG